VLKLEKTFCAASLMQIKRGHNPKKRKARLWNILHSVEQTSHWRIINLSRMIIGRGRDTMKSPDYVAIGVLVVLLVWAVADQFPRGKL